MTKLLITGDTGLLGSTLARESLLLYETFGVSRTASHTLAGWTHHSVDLTDIAETRRYLDDVRPDFIVHCAAATDVDQCEMQQGFAWAINVDATERLARWAARNGARLTFISTDSVFDGALGGYREQDSPRPLNHYARTKLAGECVAVLWCPDSLIVRTNFYGWNIKGKANLAKWMHGKLAAGDMLRAFADVYFSPLFVNDLARLILDLVSRQAKGVFHVASQDSCSKYEFAFLLGRELQFNTGKIQPAMLEEFRFHGQRPRNTSLVAKKCEQYLGREMPTLKEGIRAFAKAVAGDETAQFEKRQVQPSVELTSR
jgi:dTDP-4-dehydrorhamnose reductase